MYLLIWVPFSYSVSGSLLTQTGQRPNRDCTGIFKMYQLTGEPRSAIESGWCDCNATVPVQDGSRRIQDIECRSNAFWQVNSDKLSGGTDIIFPSGM